MRKDTLTLLPPAEARPAPPMRKAVVAAAAALLYAALLGGALYANSRELKNLDAAVGELNGRKLEMARLIAGMAGPSTAGVDAARAEIMSAMRSTPPWEAILSEISLIVPDTVWLEIIESADSRHLRLKGYSKSQAEIAKLIARLESSEHFENVEIMFSQKGERAAAFELKVEIKWT